jgi:hypothetical protein
MCFLAFTSQAQNERYLDEVFDDVVVTDTIGYGENTTVILAPNCIKRPLF